MITEREFNVRQAGRYREDAREALRDAAADMVRLAERMAQAAERADIESAIYEVGHELSWGPANVSMHVERANTRLLCALKLEAKSVNDELAAYVTRYGR